MCDDLYLFIIFISMREIKYQQRSESDEEDSSSEQSSYQEQHKEALMNAEIERVYLAICRFNNS